MSVTMHGRTTGTHSVELVHESGTVISTMAPKDNGGDGSKFSPTDLCAVSLGACGCTIMNQYAANHGVAVSGISFELIKEMSPPPRKIARLAIVFKIAGKFTEEEFRKIVAAGKACPVRLTLGNQVEVIEKYERA